MKRVLVAAAVALASLLGVALVWAMRGVVVLLLLAVATTAVLAPLVERLAKRVPRILAILLAHAALVAMVLAIGYGVVDSLAHEAAKALDSASDAYERVRSGAPSATPFERALVAHVLPRVDGHALRSDGDLAAVARGALGLTRTLLELASRALLVVVLSVYWSASGPSVSEPWLSLLGSERRKRLRCLFREMEVAVGSALRREVGLSLAVLLVLALVFRILGLQFWLLPAVAVALLRLVPALGIAFALVPVFLAGLSNGPTEATVATALTLGILVAASIAARRVVGSRRTNSVLAVVTVLVLASAWGVLGMLFAVPVAACLQVLLERLPDRARTTVVATDLTEIEARLRRLQRRFASHPPGPEVASLVERMGQLLDRAKRRALDEARYSL